MLSICIFLTAAPMQKVADMKHLIKIISWYKAKRDELKEKNGKYVPSIVFQHIPLPEYYCILRRVKRMKEKLFKHTGRINTSITDSEKHAESAELLKSRRQFPMSTAANSTPFQNAVI